MFMDLNLLYRCFGQYSLQGGPLIFGGSARKTHGVVLTTYKQKNIYPLAFCTTPKKI